MRKILLGFVMGVVFSALVLSLRDSPLEDAVLAGAAAPNMELRATKTAGDDPAPAQVSDNLNSQSRAASAAMPESTSVTLDGTSQPDSFALPEDNATLPEDEAAREARLRREVEVAQAAIRRAGTELEEMAIRRMLESNPVVSPSPLPPEFGWVADETYRGVFHERFQREPIDGAWAAPMEAELSQFVYEQPGIVERYGPPTVRCHTRRCEVLFTSSSGYGSLAEADVRTLFETSLDLWPNTFDCGPSNCWAVANEQDGVATIFWGMVVIRGDEQEPQGLVASTRE